MTNQPGGPAPVEGAWHGDPFVLATIAATFFAGLVSVGLLLAFTSGLFAMSLIWLTLALIYVSGVALALTRLST